MKKQKQINFHFAFVGCSKYAFGNATTGNGDRIFWYTSSNGSHSLSFDVYLDGAVDSLAMSLSDGNTAYVVTLSATSDDVVLHKEAEVLTHLVSSGFPIRKGLTSLWIRRTGNVYNVSKADTRPFLSWTDTDPINVQFVEFQNHGGTGYARQCPRDSKFPLFR